MVTKDLRIKKFEFVAMSEFLSFFYYKKFVLTLKLDEFKSTMKN